MRTRENLLFLRSSHYSPCSLLSALCSLLYAKYIVAMIKERKTGKLIDTLLLVRAQLLSLKPLLLLLSLIPLVSALSAQGISYEQGLHYCDSLGRAINQQNAATGERTMLRADCLTGAMLPDFTATTIDGKTIDRNYFLGKVTVISFWMKTCGPCIAEIPGLDKIKEKFGTEEVNYLAIGRCNEEEADIFLKAHPWTFDHVRNGLPVIENVFRFLWGYPVNMIIDKKGKIVLCFNGGYSGPGAVQIIQDRLVPVIVEELGK